MEIIKKGKYTFRLKKNIQEFRERILIHTYKIGGDYDDCINISYIYNNNNKPIKAKIPHLLYEPECSVSSNLDRGGGTELKYEYFYNESNGLLHLEKNLQNENEYHFHVKIL